MNQNGKIKAAMGLWVFLLAVATFTTGRSAQQFNGGAVVGVVQVTAIIPANTATPTGTLPTSTPTGSATPTSTYTPVPGLVIVVLTNTPVCAVCTGTPTMTATPPNPYAYLLDPDTGIYSVPQLSAPSATPSPGIQEMHDSELQRCLAGGATSVNFTISLATPVVAVPTVTGKIYTIYGVLLSANGSNPNSLVTFTSLSTPIPGLTNLSLGPLGGFTCGPSGWPCAKGLTSGDISVTQTGAATIYGAIQYISK